MTFEMTISGLCAFVRKSCKLKDAKALHVLMLNHRTHEPKLLVNGLYVEPIAKDEDPAVYSPDDVLDAPDGEQLFIWNLRGYRVDFATPFAVGIREGARDGHVKRPDASSGAVKNRPEDFSWVPELHRATGVPLTKALADPDALKEDMPPGYVSSRLMTLGVNPTDKNTDNWVEAVVDPDSLDRVFTFENTGYEQALADRVRLTVKSDEAPQLLLHSYARGMVTKTIRLRQLPLEPKVAVSVSNLPSHLESFMKGDSLEHFMAFYDILLDDPAQKRRPPHEYAGMSVQPVKCTLCSVCGGP